MPGGGLPPAISLVPSDTPAPVLLALTRNEISDSTLPSILTYVN